MIHVSKELAELLIKECRKRVAEPAPGLLVLEQLVVDLVDERDGWREQAQSRY